MPSDQQSLVILRYVLQSARICIADGEIVNEMYGVSPHTL
jgi:hypothetical protein